MGIYSSIVVGTAKKSAGEATFYKRLGTNCFRKKVGKRENAKFSVAQLKQQKLYKFIKANIDGGYMKPWLDIVVDAKRKSGKGQTKMNIVYQTIMPHLVAEKDTIYGFSDAEMIKPDQFLGSNFPDTAKISKGVLGANALASYSKTAALIPVAALDGYLAQANASLPAGETPYTKDDIFLAVVSDNDEGDGYVLTYPTKVAATVSNGNYSLATTGITIGGELTAVIQVVIVIGKAGEGTALDTEKAYFCTDSKFFKVGS